MVRLQTATAADYRRDCPAMALPEDDGDEDRSQHFALHAAEHSAWLTADVVLFERSRTAPIGRSPPYHRYRQTLRTPPRPPSTPLCSEPGSICRDVGATETAGGITSVIPTNCGPAAPGTRGTASPPALLPRNARSSRLAADLRGGAALPPGSGRRLGGRSRENLHRRSLSTCQRLPCPNPQPTTNTNFEQRPRRYNVA